MKNRLSTFLMVLLTVFMVTCKSCDKKAADPLASGTWTVVSVTSSLGASAVQPKFGQAVSGTFEIPSASGTYNLKTTAGAVTTGGTGTAVVTATDATSGNVVLDTKVTLTYSNLTATSVTFSGDVTAGTGKTTQNVHTIVLSRQ